MKILVNYESQDELSHGKVYAQAFKQLGHDVYLFSDVVEMQKELAARKLFFLKRVAAWSLQKKHYWRLLQDVPVFLAAPVLKSVKNAVNRKLLDFYKSVKPDLFFVCKGKVIDPDTLKAIKAINAPKLFSYNGDSHFNFYSTSDEMMRSLPIYDCVFTLARSLVEPLKQAGAKDARWLALGHDPQLHFKEDMTEAEKKENAHDIVFIGCWDRRREKELETLADLDLGIWGPRWGRLSKGSPLAEKVKGGAVDAAKMRKIYASAKVCLNLLRPQNLDAHNNRTFEIPACGGLMVANRTPEHLEFFKEGEEAMFFDDITEMRTVVLKCLNDGAQRGEMADKAHAKTIREHSYLERAKQVLVFAQKDGTDG